MTDTSLLPCPFCGCLSEIIRNSSIFIDEVRATQCGSAAGYRVECAGDCHAMTCWWHTKQDAVRYWNLRKERDALKAANIRLANAAKAFHYAFTTGNADQIRANNQLIEALYKNKVKV